MFRHSVGVVSPSELPARLEALLERFSENPAGARSQLQALLANYPGTFCAAVTPLLKQLPEDCAARQFVSALLSSSKNLPQWLSDPSAMSVKTAIELAGLLARVEPMLDVKLARWLLRGLETPPDPLAATPARAVRLLAILDALGSRRTVMVVVQLLRHPNPRVRSKAALLAGRSVGSAAWVQRHWAEPDARVRANAIEGLWGLEIPGVAAALRDALKDPDNRVVGNALVGLYLLGDPAAAAMLEDMARHHSWSFRATAAWAMGFLQDVQFIPALTGLLKDPASPVRRNALRALLRIKKAASSELPRLEGALAP